MPNEWNRREFLRVGAVSAVASTLQRGLFAQSIQAPGNPSEFKQRLRGPIVSIPTPFTAEFRLDAAGLRRMIERAQQHDIHIFELTAGDSQYSFLSYDEIKQLARLVTAAAGVRDLTIIGTGAWWTERTIDFARYAESIGATAVQILKPNGASDEGVVEHYRRVAGITKLPIVLHGNFPMTLLEHLAEIPSIVALKEDVDLSYYIDGIIRFGKRINCFSGGGLDWYVVGQPYGATAYFDSYATFAPEIAVRFWQAVQRNDYKTETEIIEKYDHPFIKNFSAPFWHASLEYFGVASRYLRPPQHSYSDAEMAEVKQFYNKLGVIPEKGRG
jgi:4-hydroxy-tetrahydrodipicolinate synthase